MTESVQTGHPEVDAALDLLDGLTGLAGERVAVLEEVHERLRAALSAPQEPAG